MTLIAVGIGEFAVSKNPLDSLITYALGPCLGVVGYDSVRSIAGLVHCQLPLSLDDPEQAKLRPARYVDSGVSLLLDQMQQCGAQLGSISICVAGAAQVTSGEGVFKIAQRNHNVFRKLMWKNSLIIQAEDTGGDRPRTLSVDVGSGSVHIVKDRIKELFFQPSPRRV
jgi:chemotaxis protein CheD